VTLDKQMIQTHFLNEENERENPETQIPSSPFCHTA